MLRRLSFKSNFVNHMMFIKEDQSQQPHHIIYKMWFEKIIYLTLLFDKN